MDCSIYIQKSWMDSKSSSFCIKTGFQCSIGLFVEYGNKKAIFLDGRYTTAAKRLLNNVEILPYDINLIKEWLQKNVSKNDKIYYDHEKFTINEAKLLFNQFKNAFGKVFQTENKKDTELRKLISLPNCLTGASYEQKFNQIRKIFTYGDALFLCSSSSIAWLCNIRDCQSFPSLMPNVFAIVKNDMECVLYSDSNIDYSATNFIVKEIDDLLLDLPKCQTVILDPYDTPQMFLSYCQSYKFQNDTCAECKIIKTDEEIANIKKINEIDSLAFTRFLDKINITKLNEIELANLLIEEKQKSNLYLCESFSPISAGDERSAEIHYNPKGCEEVSDFYLIDAGSQYIGGTTDVTRTICLGEPTNEQKEMYTRVLMGHIDVFLSSPEMTPEEIDHVARKHLQCVGKDYEHGTGHGIGYMSDVHERFVGISKNPNLKKFKKGMVLSNEPGYYKPGEYGIRIENAMCVSEDKNGKLYFESLTKIPYCQKLIIKEMLSDKQKKWLKEYEEECRKSVNKY